MSDKKKTKKPKKEEGEENTEQNDKKSKKPEKKGEPDIDTKGRDVKHAPGGKLLFQALEAQGVAKKPIPMIIHVDIDDREVFKSKATKGDKWKFEGRPEFFPCQPEDATVKVSLHEKVLVGTKLKGEIKLAMDTLYSGYPFDQWFELTKEGKEEKSLGALKLRFLYVAPNQEPRHDEFRYPLHSLIQSNRLDLFSRKLDDLKHAQEKKPNPDQEEEAAEEGEDDEAHVVDPAYLSKEDDKKMTPLLLSASLGRAGFFKLLNQAGANLEELDGDGRNCAHLAAQNGHVKILEYLSFLGKMTLLSAEDQKDKRTPLHLAALANQGDAVTALVAAGVDVNPRDVKNDTPLTAALLVEGGASSAITALIKGGADVYAANNLHGVPAWEMATNREICFAILARQAFLKACDVIDPREFEIAQKFPKKKRVEGKGLSPDWETATQFILYAEKATKVSILVYSKTRTDDSIKQVAFCVVKNSQNQRTYKMPSFQQEGMGFGSTKPFECIIEPELSYNIMTYCTKEELNGDFLLCIFTGQGAEEVICKEAIPWPHQARVSSAWKKGTAAGSGDYTSNPGFTLTASKDGEVLVMLKQAMKDVTAGILPDGGHRIVPSKYYVGFYVLQGGAEFTKTDKWVNSYDVYQFMNLKAGKEYTIYPCTQKEGQEVAFEMFAYSTVKISLDKLE